MGGKPSSSPFETIFGIPQGGGIAELTAGSTRQSLQNVTPPKVPSLRPTDPQSFKKKKPGAFDLFGTLFAGLSGAGQTGALATAPTSQPKKILG